MATQRAGMSWRMKPALDIWLLFFGFLLTCVLGGQESVAKTDRPSGIRSSSQRRDDRKRFEVDLLRLMNGTFASTTLSTTISIKNGTATAVFSGDTSSSQIEEVYLMFATSQKHIAEIRLSNKGTATLSSYKPSHVPYETGKKGNISFSILNNQTWHGQASIDFPLMDGEINKYAMAAKLSLGDTESPSSYMCSYGLKNSALSIPDLQVLEQFNDV